MKVSKWLGEGEFRSVIESSVDCVKVIDLRGRVRFMNRAGLALMEVNDFATVEGRAWESLWPEAARGEIRKAIEAAGRGEQYRFDAQVPTCAGVMKWWDVIVSPLLDDDGKLGGMISTSRDITAGVRARLEAEAREHELTRMTGALQSAHRIAQLGGWVYNCISRRVFFSTELCDILGSSRQDQPLLESLETIAEECRLPFVHELEQAERSRRRMSFEARFLAPDGSSRWMSIQGEPEIVDGRCVGFSGVSQDITDQRLAMERLQASEQTARKAADAMSGFLATMSHEIRTPLNGVLGMAQAMAIDELPEAQRERLSVIQVSGEALLGLLNDLLDLSRIEAGKAELEDGVIDAQELADGAEAFAALLAEKDVELRLALAPEARGLWAGDPKRVRQILHNLIANAVKFTDHGSVDVRIFQDDAGRLGLRVRDTGIGIRPERLAHVFDRFVQADASMTRRYGGSGLGLAICRDLVGLMGGEIAVDSVEGEGATFTVHLPLPRAADPVAKAEADMPLAAPAHGLRVLAAEDNPMNQLVLKTLLASAGIEPVLASNGDEAVKAWRRDSWDIVLMDIQMPVMDGVAAIRKIRETERREGRARTPVIAVTANAMAHHQAEYLTAGMDAVVAKPISLSALLQAMDLLLEPQAQGPLAVSA